MKIHSVQFHRQWSYSPNCIVIFGSFFQLNNHKSPCVGAQIAQWNRTMLSRFCAVHFTLVSNIFFLSFLNFIESENNNDLFFLMIPCESKEYKNIHKHTLRRNEKLDWRAASKVQKFCCRFICLVLEWNQKTSFFNVRLPLFNDLFNSSFYAFW